MLSIKTDRMRVNEISNMNFRNPKRESEKIKKEKISKGAEHVSFKDMLDKLIANP